MKPTAAPPAARRMPALTGSILLTISWLFPAAKTQALTRIKAATGTDLAAAASWDTPPGAQDAATWTETSLGAGLILASPASWSGIRVTGALSAIDLSGAGPLTLGSAGINMTDSTVDLTIASPLSLGSAQCWTVGAGRNLSALGSVDGTVTLSKAGAGTLTLAGANVATGATTVTGGTLVLDYSSHDASKLADAATLTLAGAHLRLDGGSHPELAGPFRLNAGASSITSLSGSATLGLEGITRASGGTLWLSAADRVKTPTGAVGTILNASGKAYAVIDGNDWAAKDAANAFIVGLSSVTNYNPTHAGALGGVGKHSDVAAAVTTTTLSVNASTSTLRFNVPQATTLDLNGHTAAITQGGILVTPAVGANLSRITGGTLTTGSNHELIFWQNNTSGELVVDSVVANAASGNAVLTKSGAGTLALAGGNSYTGATFVNAGILRVDGSLDANSAVWVADGAVLSGTGTIHGTLTTQSGATLQPTLAGSPGTLGLTHATAPVFAANTTLKLRAAAGMLDQLLLSDAAAVFSCANLRLVIDADALSENMLGATLVQAAGGVAGTFLNITASNGYVATLHYHANSITVDLTGSGATDPFATWLASHGLSGAAAAAGADPDRDGINNALEFVLGGQPNPARPNCNSVHLLPAVAEESGNLVFTFRRAKPALNHSTLVFQWSTDLAFSSPVNELAVGAQSSPANGVVVLENSPDATTDTVVITVPAAMAAPGGKLFARLRASLP